MKKGTNYFPGKPLLTFLIALVALLAADSAAADCVAPAAGLVGWWKGDGTALDTTGTNNGTLVNVGFTNGVVGSTFAFDPENFPYGTFTGVKIADQPAYALTNSLTIEGWIRPRGDSYVIFLRGDGRPGLDPYSIVMNGSHDFAFNIGDANGNGVSLHANLAYNQWVHVGATLDGSTGTMSLYTNGVMASQTNTSIRPFGALDPNQSPGVGIGNLNDGGNSFPFIGDVDEISLYNRALTTNEIAAIYNAGNAGKCTSPPTTCVTPPSGLVSWWQGENNPNDSIGGNNGILRNAPGFAGGKVGAACNFSGSNDCVEIPYSASLSPAQFTVEAWVKPSAQVSDSINQDLIFGQGNGHGQLVVRTGTTGLHVVWQFGTSPSNFPGVQSTTEIPIGQFSHLAGSWDGTTLRLYINGVLNAQSTPGATPVDSGCPFFIGGFYSPAADSCQYVGQFFNGLIDEVSLYNRALTTNEIAAIYNAGSAGKCTDSLNSPVVLVDNSTAGYYNNSLGTILDGTAPQFPLPLGIGADSTIYPADEPPLTPAATVLGNWLAPNAALNGNWLSPGPIPTTWTLNTETAIIYEVNGGQNGFSNLRCDLDADNGIFVWVNGQYKFGAREPGLPSPLGQFEYTNIDLGILLPGTNRIQIIREDSGISTGYQIRISGIPQTNTVPFAPFITQQPTNRSVTVSNTATFNVSATGTAPITFQWLLNGTNLDGATGATLTLTNVQFAQAGNYSVLVSNFVGAAISSNAVLTVHEPVNPPVITQQPGGAHLPPGSNVTFTVTVDGTPPFNFQWYHGGTPLVDDGRIVGATTTSLSISNLVTTDAGSYAVVVTNEAGSDVSYSATLIVQVPPAIATQPLGRSVPPGLPTTFTGTASGSPSPVYQWQLNGTNLPGATSTSYTIAAVGTNQLGNYQIVASNEVSSVTSSVAQLTFGPVAAWGRNFNNESLPPPNLSGVIAIGGNSSAGFALRTNGVIASWGSGSFPGATNIPPNATNIVAISTQADSGVALRANGTVVGWNAQIPVLSNIVSVAAGGNNFGLALRVEGTVINWGVIAYGVPPAGLNHVAAIAAGYTHSLALRNDGTVVGWGVGIGTNVPAGLSGVTAIAAGYSHSLALKTNGTVVAWGSGKGTNLPPGLTNITTISASSISSGQTLCLAIRANGTVVAWGDNVNGETNVPPALSNLISVAIAAAPFHGLVLINDGKPQILQPPIGLTTWSGRDVTFPARAVGAAPLTYQWLLNGTNLPAATNVTLALKNIQLSDAGDYQLFVSNALGTALSLPATVNVISNNTLLFLSQTTNGITNYQGSRIVTGSFTVLGNGPLRYQWLYSPTNKNYVALPGATNETLALDPALAAQSGSYYIAISNQVAGITSPAVNIRVLFAKAWGFQSVSNPPVNITNAVALATGGAQGSPNGLYYALGADGRLTSWANYFSSYGETNVTGANNYFITAIAAGYQHGLALKSDGTVYAFGYGGYGQTNPPVGLNGVTAVACGGYHDLALKSDGTVVGWGANPQSPNYGQATNYPAATNVVAIAAGNMHSLVLRADGTVVGWGYGGDGATTIPVTATNVIAIAAGSGFSAALRTNGTVVQWGSSMNSYPVPTTLSNVVAISGSANHCTALRKDGTVVSWGYEYVGLASNNVPSDLTNVIAITSGGDHDFGLFGTRAPAFTVQPWNRTVIFNTAAKIAIAARCAGVQPISYQWQLNGTNLPAATNDTLILTNQPFAGAPIQLIAPGAYQLVASNAYGVAVSKPAKLTVVVPLGVAMDATNLNWLTSGNAQWFGQTNVTHDGVDAVRSGGIGTLQESILQTTFATNYPGQFKFWWKVSSEQFFDTLEFRVNGNVMASISGEADWQQASVAAGAGTNVLQWRYSKDSSYDAGQDAGWVDQFSFVPNPPVITNQPVNLTLNYLANGGLAVGAFGAPPMTYRWRHDGTPTGGNNLNLSLAGTSRDVGGNYFVIVSNLSGAVTSSVAVVKVLMPQTLGTPVLLPDGSMQITSSDANGGLLSESDLANFEVQASTNLVNWTTLTNALSLTNGLLNLSDSTQTNFSARYYRIVEH